MLLLLLPCAQCPVLLLYSRPSLILLLHGRLTSVHLLHRLHHLLLLLLLLRRPKVMRNAWCCGMQPLVLPHCIEGRWSALQLLLPLRGPIAMHLSRQCGMLCCLPLHTAGAIARPFTWQHNTCVLHLHLPRWRVVAACLPLSTPSARQFV